MQVTAVYHAPDASELYFYRLTELLANTFPLRPAHIIYFAASTRIGKRT